MRKDATANCSPTLSRFRPTDAEAVPAAVAVTGRGRCSPIGSAAVSDFEVERWTFDVRCVSRLPASTMRS